MNIVNVLHKESFLEKRIVELGARVEIVPGENIPVCVQVTIRISYGRMSNSSIELGPTGVFKTASTSTANNSNFECDAQSTPANCILNIKILPFFLNHHEYVIDHASHSIGKRNIPSQIVMFNFNSTVLCSTMVKTAECSS